ncbi:uncharacterized protein LOC129565286 isoform X2 [Sitodiplosis mosellana]|uniref:uncharacterized protein LOC129565286 isoform X2 n=1 Tax=Sitodiplosis mosellana TaxID=263140 RepID=UPI0024442149|nr:uncharacterized protein LOC129565286 isoform X2 [Sitodiplosis mosellana]XP_055295964.1 uncharacterized protein LOC129565286 isoform X2 [Sitodiplosis mosellana]
MSGKDETDLVQNKELSMENATTAQSMKSINHDPSNGDTAPVNGDSLTNPEETSKQSAVESSTPKPSTPSNWVQFENEDDSSDKHESPNKYKQSPAQAASSTSASQPPPVLTTESVHINIKNLPSSQVAQKPLATSSPAVIEIETKNNLNKSVTTSFSTPTPTPNEQGLRTIELSSGRVREGFANGDVIVTLLPINTRWPWITPALFRPELVPEELMAQGLTLTVEEYVHAMETLVNDFRFTLYNVCYKRVLLCWVLFAFLVLLGLLFSGLKGIPLFSLGVGWLFLNAAAIFMCMWLKLRLARGLERCLASVNKQLIKHKIILALDDRGRISCHKVNLCFMYYDPEQCVNYLNDFIERCEQNGNTIEAGWESRLDVDVNDIIIQGSNTTRVSKRKERALLLFLRYASRWGNQTMRGFIKTGVTEPARHCAPYICPCQFIEEHLKCKPQGLCKYGFESNFYSKFPPLLANKVNEFLWLNFEM